MIARDCMWVTSVPQVEMEDDATTAHPVGRWWATFISQTFSSLPMSAPALRIHKQIYYKML